MLLCYDKLDKLTYLDGKLVKKDIYNGKKRTIRFYINVCKYCGEEFLSYKLNGKYCNNSCHFKFIHENMTEDDKIKFKNKISLTKKKNPSPA